MGSSYVVPYEVSANMCKLSVVAFVRDARSFLCGSLFNVSFMCDVYGDFLSPATRGLTAITAAATDFAVRTCVRLRPRRRGEERFMRFVQKAKRGEGTGRGGCTGSVAGALQDTPEVSCYDDFLYSLGSSLTENV